MKITEAAIVITTKCNMRCPKCFLGIPERKQADVPLQHLVVIASQLKGIDKLHITGGEPTLHDGFGRLGSILKDASEAKSIVVMTNAANPTHPGLWHYDKVYVSRYYEDMWPGYKGNKERCYTLVRSFDGMDLSVGNITDGSHFPERTEPGGKPCHRASLGLVLVFEDMVYPCCSPPVTPGSDVEGVPLCNPDWRSQVEEMTPPCDKCRFAV